MRNNNTKITLALFALIVAVIITVPVVYGYLLNPPNKIFLGITGLRPIEQFYYLSVGPSQSVKGHLLFADRYQRLPDEDVLINPIGNVIGLISWTTGLSLPVSFNIFRILSSLLLILSFYLLAKQFITSSITFLAAVLLYCFSGGFDSLFYLLNISWIDAVDDSMPEANMFIAMSGEYYLPLANALFILALAAANNFIYKEGKGFLLCGVSLFLLGAIYIYGLVTAVMIISIATIYKGYVQKELKAASITLFKLSLFCLPITCYYLWLIFRFPSINEEGWFSFPSFLSLISTFGFAFLFTIAGLLFKGRIKILEEGFLFMWIFITLFLIYVPLRILPIQVQMLIGLGAPLSILFATSLEAIGKSIFERRFVQKKQTQRVFMGLVILCIIILSSSTNISFYKRQFHDLQKQILPWYIDSKVDEAIQWSAQNISDKNLVITSRKMGFIFSSATACRVYTGVGRFRQKTDEQNNTEEALNFLRNNKVEEARQILNRTKADYLLLDQSLAGADFYKLREILKTSYQESFANSEASIFQLK